MKKSSDEEAPTPIAAASKKATARRDDLGMPWHLWADGKPHRLKKGKHYTVDSKRVQEAAKAASQKMGITVRSARDQISNKHEYVWVQFADHATFIGEPCPCGGRELARLHRHYARCESCGATLALTEP